MKSILIGLAIAMAIHIFCKYFILKELTAYEAGCATGKWIREDILLLKELKEGEGCDDK